MLFGRARFARDTMSSIDAVSADAGADAGANAAVSTDAEAVAPTPPTPALPVVGVEATLPTPALQRTDPPPSVSGPASAGPRVPLFTRPSVPFGHLYELAFAALRSAAGEISHLHLSVETPGDLFRRACLLVRAAGAGVTPVPLDPPVAPRPSSIVSAIQVCLERAGRIPSGDEGDFNDSDVGFLGDILQNICVGSSTSGKGPAGVPGGPPTDVPKGTRTAPFWLATRAWIWEALELLPSPEKIDQGIITLREQVEANTMNPFDKNKALNLITDWENCRPTLVAIAALPKAQRTPAAAAATTTQTFTALVNPFARSTRRNSPALDAAGGDAEQAIVVDQLSHHGRSPNDRVTLDAHYRAPETVDDLITEVRDLHGPGAASATRGLACLRGTNHPLSSASSVSSGGLYLSQQPHMDGYLRTQTGGGVGDTGGGDALDERDHRRGRNVVAEFALNRYLDQGGPLATSPDILLDGRRKPGLMIIPMDRGRGLGVQDNGFRLPTYLLETAAVPSFGRTLSSYTMAGTFLGSSVLHKLRPIDQAEDAVTSALRLYTKHGVTYGALAQLSKPPKDMDLFLAAATASTGTNQSIGAKQMELFVKQSRTHLQLGGLRLDTKDPVDRDLISALCRIDIIDVMKSWARLTQGGAIKDWPTLKEALMNLRDAFSIVVRGGPVRATFGFDSAILRLEGMATGSTPLPWTSLRRGVTALLINLDKMVSQYEADLELVKEGGQAACIIPSLSPSGPLAECYHDYARIFRHNFEMPAAHPSFAVEVPRSEAQLKAQAKLAQLQALKDERAKLHELMVGSKRGDGGRNKALDPDDSKKRKTGDDSKKRKTGDGPVGDRPCAKFLVDIANGTTPVICDPDVCKFKHEADDWPRAAAKALCLKNGASANKRFATLWKLN